jgi:hypothetical protein
VRLRVKRNARITPATRNMPSPKPIPSCDHSMSRLVAVEVGAAGESPVPTGAPASPVASPWSRTMPRDDDQREALAAVSASDGAATERQLRLRGIAVVAGSTTSGDG